MTRTWAVAVMVLFGWIAPAGAATVFFYSDVDEYYGWAAGYNYGRSELEAEAACRNAGGSDCRFAIECAGGWSAIAYADDSARGVGMACGFGSALTARVIAISLCMSAARAMCWTESAFDNNANEISSANNDRFDTTYFAQIMLYSLGFMNKSDTADGKLGPRTRAAARAFQTRLGLAPDGDVTISLLWRLLNAFGGPQKLAGALYQAHIEPNLDQLSGRIYATASAPQPERPYGEELATYIEPEQRLALATMLTMWGEPCTLPATSVRPIPPDGTGGWQVRCAEGDFTVIFDSATQVISRELREITVRDGAVTMSGDGPTEPPATGNGHRRSPG